MSRHADGIWVVTGAASGFGRAFARALGARGERLSLWDRDAAGVATVGEALGAHTATVDITDAAATRLAADQTAREAGPIAHVIHCAGVLRVGDAVAMDASEYALMMDVNVRGSIHVAQATVPHLRERRGRATLLLTASVAGLHGMPQLAGYCASKFAVIGFAESLRSELRDTSVDIRVLCPPAADTPMVQNLERVPPIYKLSPLVSAEEVVAKTLRGLDRRGWKLLIDPGGKALELLGRLSPGLVDAVFRWADRD